MIDTRTEESLKAKSAKTAGRTTKRQLEKQVDTKKHTGHLHYFKESFENNMVKSHFSDFQQQPHFDLCTSPCTYSVPDDPLDIFLFKI